MTHVDRCLNRKNWGRREVRMADMQEALEEASSRLRLEVSSTWTAPSTLTVEPEATTLAADLEAQSGSMWTTCEDTATSERLEDSDRKPLVVVLAVVLLSIQLPTTNTAAPSRFETILIIFVPISSQISA